MSKFNRIHALALAAAFAVAAPAALAQHAGHGDHGAAASAAAPAASEYNEGEIKKIDAAAGKLTIKHGELKGLGMPPMTMVFRTADPALLKDRKVGEKIHFKAEKRGSGFVVTEINAH
jgi:Cu(I)/Ag(I) efflux system protein CusF